MKHPRQQAPLRYALSLVTDLNGERPFHEREVHTYANQDGNYIAEDRVRSFLSVLVSNEVLIKYEGGPLGTMFTLGPKYDKWANPTRYGKASIRINQEDRERIEQAWEENMTATRHRMDEAREVAGITFRDLDVLMCIGHGYSWKIIHGRRPLRLLFAWQFCKVVGCSLDWLLGLEHEQKAPG